MESNQIAFKLTGNQCDKIVNQEPNTTSAAQIQDVPQEIIFKFLGCLETADLLNCRRVCRVWDKECKTHILRKSKPIRMTPEKLDSYTTFVKNTNSNLNMPIELLHAHRLADSEPSSLELESNVEYLISKFGQKTITGLSWRFDCGTGVDSFLRILIKISEGLEHLFLLDCSIPTKEAVSRQLDQLTLPNLKETRVISWSGPEPEKTDLLESILVKSPLLEKLEIAFPFSAHGLILLVETRTFVGHPTPSSFKSTIKILDSTLLNQLAPTLKTFGLQLGMSRLQEPLGNPFPNLPHLEQLRFERVHTVGESSPLFFDPIFYEFTPVRMPALTKVALPIGMFLSMDDSMGSRVCFTSVTDLTLLTMFCMYGQNVSRETVWRDLELFSRNVCNLLSTFPNASKLNLTLRTKNRQERTLVKNLVGEILGCPLAGRIQELWVESEQDFVGQVLKEIDDDEGPKLRSPIRMTNIKKFCFEASYGTPLVLGFEGVEPGWSQGTLHLTLIAKYFPNIRNFQVSFQALSFGDYAARWRKVHEIQKKFPNWKVDLIPSRDLEF